MTLNKGLEPAVFEIAVFEDAVFEDAVFEDAVFEDAVFEDAVFEDAVFEDAVFEDAVSRMLVSALPDRGELIPFLCPWIPTDSLIRYFLLDSCSLCELPRSSTTVSSSQKPMPISWIATISSSSKTDMASQMIQQGFNGMGSLCVLADCWIDEVPRDLYGRLNEP